MTDVWQEKREFEETNLHMLNDNVLCDVTFLVGPNKDEVQAHKFMLASRSPVFHAMFCGPMSETSSTIEIPDIERETMGPFLRFIYTEDCHVNGEIVMSLLYTAKKYCVKRLERKCLALLTDHIHNENACSIFAQAHLLSEQELKHRCFKFIITNYKQVLPTEGFRTLPKELLKEILESDEINATEEDVYDSCKQWAAFHLRNTEESSATIQSDIRNILGDLLYLVRFPNMSMETFSTKCSTDNVLSKEEKVSIVQFIAAGSKDEQLKFSDKKRAGFRHTLITRFRERGPSVWMYDGKTDAIDFSVSETAMIFGIGLFSPYQKSGTVKGVVSLLSETTSKSVLMDKEVEIKYCPLKYHEEVLFDEGVSLKPNTKYTIEVVLEGSHTFHGDNGLSEVTEGDFNVTFCDSGISTNFTDVRNGQIPFLILGIRQK